MKVTLNPEFQHLIDDKLRTGEYRSADEVLNAAIQLFKERQEDRDVLDRVNAGEALPADDRFTARLEILLQEAKESGGPAEMSEEDWADIRREGLSRLRAPN